MEIKSNLGEMQKAALHDKSSLFVVKCGFEFDILGMRLYVEILLKHDMHKYNL